MTKAFAIDQHDLYIKGYRRIFFDNFFYLTNKIFLFFFLREIYNKKNYLSNNLSPDKFKT